MEKHYFVVLGDNGNRHQSDMVNNLNALGKVDRILDNLYLLSIPANSKIDDVEKVRNQIAGKNFGYCMVFSITSKLSCAWNVPQNSCEQLVDVFKKIVNSDEKE